MSRVRRYEVTAEQWAALPFIVRSTEAGYENGLEVDAIGTDNLEDALDMARNELRQGYNVRIEQQ